MAYANKIMLQMSDTVRLIFHDERPAVGDREGAMVTATAAEIVLSHENARALRDLLNQHIKDGATIQ